MEAEKEQILEVYRAFTQEMCDYETRIHEEREPYIVFDPLGWDKKKVIQECLDIVDKYCTSRKRLDDLGRNYRFPPEYDNANEKIIEFTLDKNKASIIVLRKHPKSENYDNSHLKKAYAFKKVADQWRLDTVKQIYLDGTADRIL